MVNVYRVTIIIGRKQRMSEIELLLDKKSIVHQSDFISDDFYENEKDNAVNLIALSLIRELFENKLVSEKEYLYVKNIYVCN